MHPSRSDDDRALPTDHEPAGPERVEAILDATECLADGAHSGLCPRLQPPATRLASAPDRGDRR